MKSFWLAIWRADFKIKAMSKVLRSWLAACFLATAAISVSASTFVYIIDTSDSMKRYRPLVIDAVMRDVEKALQTDPTIFRPGDRIYLWSFSSEVRERLKIEFAPNSENKFRAQFESELGRLRWGGITSLARPLLKSLEEFRPAEAGHLSLFLYTDGRDSISDRYFETLLRIYNHSFKIESRMDHFFVVQFGKEVVPESARKLFAALDGKIVAANRSIDLRTVGAPATPRPTVIGITPKSIEVSSDIAPEIVKSVPVEFTIDPPQAGLSIGLSLEVAGLPKGMSIATTADHLATEGKQSISFLMRNAQPGRYSATLKFAAAARFEPGELPVQIEIRAPAAPPKVESTVGVQFLPETVMPVELPAGSDWQRIPNVGLSLFYPDNLKDAKVRMDYEGSVGVGWRILPGGESAQPLAIGKAYPLAEFGRTASFQIRQESPVVIGQDLVALLSLQLEPDQNIKLQGTAKTAIPVRFVSQMSPTEVRLGNREISLGTLKRGAQSAPGTLTLQVLGPAQGMKLRLAKQGRGFEGITITPAEIPLAPGDLPVVLNFAGFENRPPGDIDGVLTLVPAENSPPFRVPVEPVRVRGRIAESGKLLVELENPMLAGRPLIVRASMETREQTIFTATVRPPESRQDYEVPLVDDGSAESGDAKANDGVYSGIFKRTDSLGKYEVTVSAPGATNIPQKVSLPAVYYFKADPQPLVGTITRRDAGELINLKAKVTSSFPTGVEIQMESGPTNVPLNTYFSNKTLEPGENLVQVLVGLTTESRTGDFKYQIHLATKPIAGRSVKIPLSFEVAVLSPFHYFVRMAAATLALALVVFLAIVAPWKKAGFLNGGRRLKPTRET